MVKEKKEKENVLIDFELVNLKKVSLLQFEELKRKTIEVEKDKLLKEKEYQMNLQYLQAKLEMAQEQKNSLNLAGVKKRLEDYEQMQYYTLMKMKNKIKDFDAEFEER